MNSSILYKTLLTKEQRDKRRLVSEAMDRKGLVVRYRVEDQTIFDGMFIAELIDRPQHDAGHSFLAVVEMSGAYPPSCNLEASFSTPMYRVGDAIGERRMAFGSAYRFVVRECGEKQADKFVRLVGDIFTPTDTSDKMFMRSLSRIAYKPLRVLAKYFRTDSKRDPRDIAREGSV